jgi:cytochrome c556
MKRFAVGFSLFALAASAAVVAAQEDVIKARQDFMKENGRLLGAMGPMAKGEQPFDGAQAQSMLQALDDHVKQLDVEKLFPEGSTQGKTRALPKIWENFDDFKQHAEKLKTDTAAAAQSAPQDAKALQAAMGSIGQACTSCHDMYRQPQS